MKFTSEDLLKAMGLKVGDIVTAKFYKYKFIITESDNYLVLIDNDGDYWPFELLIKNDYEIIQPKPTLTEDEKVILRNLDKKWKWITKDNYEEPKIINNDLVLFEHKPIKNDYFFEASVENTDSVYFSGFNHLFKFIKPMECYSIEELLKE